MFAFQQFDYDVSKGAFVSISLYLSFFGFAELIESWVNVSHVFKKILGHSNISRGTQITCLLGHYIYPRCVCVCVCVYVCVYICVRYLECRVSDIS